MYLFVCVCVCVCAKNILGSYRAWSLKIMASIVPACVRLQPINNGWGLILEGDGVVVRSSDYTLSAGRGSPVRQDALYHPF